jgi:hypothetical protein
VVAKRSARAGRTQTINQARALVLTGPAGRSATAALAHPRRMRPHRQPILAPVSVRILTGMYKPPGGAARSRGS